MADETENRKTRDLMRVVGKMHHDLEFERAEEILDGDLNAYFERFRNDLKSVHTLLYQLYISREAQF